MGRVEALEKADRAVLRLVGGKAASLGEMIQAGLPVPTGFVVTTEAYQSAKGKVSPELEAEILNWYDNLKLQRVAVRSSAIAEDSPTASWAGQLESYLNVERDGVIEALRKCWQSVESERAQEYAEQNGVSKSGLALGVVIQAMVESDRAGVLFTANPVTSARDEVMIEAIYGLGEYLVQGIVTPDNYVLDRKGVLKFHTSHRQVKKLVLGKTGNIEKELAEEELNRRTLTEAQLHELVNLADKVEQHYGVPQDIEWAIENDMIYIVQSRPITTLVNKA